MDNETQQALIKAFDIIGDRLTSLEQSQEDIRQVLTRLVDILARG